MTSDQADGPADIMRNTPALANAKQHLRSMMKQKLQSLSAGSISSQSATVYNTLLKFKPYLDARRVSIFLSMPAAEVQTDAIVRHALQAGKQVYVPYLHKAPPHSSDTPSRVMDMVLLKDLPDYESLKRDRWGIPSIDPATVDERRRILGGPDSQHSETSILDLVLMPGVAFDIEPGTGLIRRCGHGKGFYDFFIERYLFKIASLDSENVPPVKLYGLALAEQLLDPASGHTIPVNALDQALDGLVLGNGEIKAPIHLD